MFEDVPRWAWKLIRNANFGDGGDGGGDSGGDGTGGGTGGDSSSSDSSGAESSGAPGTSSDTSGDPGGVSAPGGDAAPADSSGAPTSTGADQGVTGAAALGTGTDAGLAGVGGSGPMGGGDAFGAMGGPAVGGAIATGSGPGTVGGFGAGAPDSGVLGDAGPTFGADPSGVLGTGPGLGPDALGNIGGPGFFNSTVAAGPPDAPGPLSGGFPATPASIVNDAFNAPDLAFTTALGGPGILGAGDLDALSAGPFGLGPTAVATTSVTGAPPSVSAPQVSDAPGVAPFGSQGPEAIAVSGTGKGGGEVATGAPTDLSPSTPAGPTSPGPTEGPSTPGVNTADIATGTAPTDPGSIAGLVGGSGGGGDVLSPHGILGAGGPLAGVLGAGAGIAGQPGGIELASGVTVPDLMSGQAMSAEQIVAFTNAQTSLLSAWSAVIPESDPRWPAVVQLVNQQALQQVSGGQQMAA
jgi:hypothetical protein